MSFDYVIDSYAWLEYYTGTEAGLKMKDIIEKGNLATPIIVIAELSDKFARQNTKFDDLFQFISSRSKIVPITMDIALKSGSLKSDMRKQFSQFGLADAIIYLTAKLSSAKLLTGDAHLKSLPGVEFIA